MEVDGATVPHLFGSQWSFLRGHAIHFHHDFLVPGVSWTICLNRPTSVTPVHDR